VISVLVVDDQAMVREGFSALLNAQEGISVLGTAADGLEAVAKAAQLRPDVVVMDIRMPRMDGIEATRQIMAGAGEREVHVLVLTTFDLDEYVVDALRAGASGFLLKDATAAQLTEAVHTVARGEALLAPSLTKRLIETYLDARRAPAPVSGRLDVLTPREKEVLALVAEGLSNREIAERLFLAEQTVKTHVSHVFTKCDIRDRAQAVILAYESGLVTPGG